jgi:hypothetical protein
MLCGAVVFAQELTINAEVRTGLLWEKEEKVAQDTDEKVGLGSKDDAGNDTGRFQLDMQYTILNMGVKTRLRWDNWNNNQVAPEWNYAFLYGDFFNNQFTLSAGKLGASPWGTGGPEMWKELEITKFGGMRFEYKPAFVPGELNIGFVLNWTDGSKDQGVSRAVTLADLLRESVLGVSYVHDYFLVRFAYRLDSELDVRPGSMSSGGVDEGDDLIYRVEERILKNYLPGFQIWALGFWAGVGAESDIFVKSENWLFTEYAHEWFTAQIRFGFDVVSNRSILHFKPSFYWNFFEKLLTVGASFWYGQDFGEGKMYPGAPYTYMEIEPKLQVNFNPNTYAAFAYNFRREYINKEHEQPGYAPINQRQWMNLRVGLKL